MYIRTDDPFDFGGIILNSNARYLWLPLLSVNLYFICVADGVFALLCFAYLWENSCDFLVTGAKHVLSFTFFYILGSSVGQGRWPLTGVICALLGVSTSIFLGLQTLKRWERERIDSERVKLMVEAVGQAEERCLGLQERHDRILNLVTGKYFVRKDLEADLQKAQTAMNEAPDFSTSLQGLLLEGGTQELPT